VQEISNMKDEIITFKNYGKSKLLDMINQK